MDKTTLTQMRAYLEVALQDFEKHFDVQCNIGKIRYSKNNAVVKLEIAKITEEGEVLSKIVEDYRFYGNLYELKPEWLGEKFSLNGETFTLKGLNNRAKKYKILALGEDGKTYKMLPSTVKNAMV